MIIGIGDYTLGVQVPFTLKDAFQALFKLIARDDGLATQNALITEQEDGLFRLEVEGQIQADALEPVALAGALLDTLTNEFSRQSGHVVLNAGLVGWRDSSILIVADCQSDLSIFVAWFMDKGFTYLSESAVILGSEPGQVTGFPAPLRLSLETLTYISGMRAFENLPALADGDKAILCPDPAWPSEPLTVKCNLVLFARMTKANRLQRDLYWRNFKLKAIDEPDCLARLANVCLCPPGDVQRARAEEILAPLMGSVASVSAVCADVSEFTGIVDNLARMASDQAMGRNDLQHFLANLQGEHWSQFRPAATAPARTADRPDPVRLTIGMATYDDYDGVYFTIQALRLYHREILDHTEFLIIDNNPHGRCGPALKRLENWADNIRYVPVAGDLANWSRQRIFEEARGDIVLCMDCHVLFPPSAISKLLDYFDANPGSRDLIQGPLVKDDLSIMSPDWNHEWVGGFWGSWNYRMPADTPDGPAFEIQLQGLGAFACRREAWPGYNPAFRSFGEEEGYLHEKFRQRGDRALCLPAFRWIHRFERPMGQPYPTNWHDRIRNYIIAYCELGLPTQDLQAYFETFLASTREPIKQQLAELFASVKAELAPAPKESGSL